MTKPAGASGATTAFVAITALFGLFAGVGSLLAILGGVALTIRFRSSGLPAEAIVAGLPTTLFLSIGLDVALQLLIFAALTFLAVLTAARRRFVLVLLAAFVLAYPFTRTVEAWQWGALVVAGLLSAFAIAAAVRNAARRLGARRVSRRTLARVATTRGAACALLIFAGWRIAFECLAIDVLDAKVCVTVKQEESGVFIGESDSSVYVGVTEPGPARIVEIPREKVKRVFIGRDATNAECPPT